TPEGKDELEEVLPAYMKERRWFGGKARKIRLARIRQSIRVTYGAASAAHVCLVEVEYTEGSGETYLLPLTFTVGEHAAKIRQEAPHAALALVNGKNEGLLCDALIEPDFASRILEAIGSNRPLEEVEETSLVPAALASFEQVRTQSDAPLTPSFS